MGVALDSFGRSLLDAFIQSPVDARFQPGLVKTVFISENMRMNTLTTSQNQATISASGSSTRRGQVYLLKSSWPPTEPASGTSSSVETGIGRSISGDYVIRRGLFQFDVPSGISITGASLYVWINPLFNGITPSSISPQFYEVADFAPRDLTDYGLSGTLVGSTTVTKGSSAQYYTVALSGYSITPGSVYSIQVRSDLEGTKPSNQSATEAEFTSGIYLILTL